MCGGSITLTVCGQEMPAVHFSPPSHSGMTSGGHTTARPYAHQYYYDQDHINKGRHPLVTETQRQKRSECFVPKLRKVSIDHLRRVWYANRGRFLLRTPGPVPCRTCVYSPCWDQCHPLPIRYYKNFRLCFTGNDIITLFNLWTEYQGLQRTFSMGMACRHGSLTPPNT